MSLSLRDLYLWTESVALEDAHSKRVGTLLLEYEVRPYHDVRNLSLLRGYLISCKQRLTIESASRFESDRFSGYPALLKNSVQLIPRSPAEAEVHLIDYAPRTLNSSISSNQSSTAGSELSASSQYTSGSSTSETNSYDVSVNVGFSGEAPTGGVSSTTGHSETETEEHSKTRGSTLGRDLQSASSDAMTIRDWGSYAVVDAANQSPSWAWGQEYPWDVLEFQTQRGDYIMLPGFVKQRLGQKDPDTKLWTIFPPSKLSLFGLNFVTKATWLYTMAPGSPGIDDSISFKHTVSLTAAAHGLFQGEIEGQLTPVISEFSYPPEKSDLSTLDLARLALDPISADPGDSGAIVGFVPSQFVAPPAAGQSFQIKSAANNLLVTASGFDVPASEDAPLQVAALTSKAPATLRAAFKIADTEEIYALFLKNWKLTQGGCVLNIHVNGGGPIVRHVDSAESGSGSENVTQVILRHRDYTSSEFYDYLVMGINELEITISPAEPATSSGYAIRALAIA